MSTYRRNVTIIILSFIALDILIVMYTNVKYYGTHQLLGNPVESMLIWIVCIILLCVGTFFKIEISPYQRHLVTLFLVFTIATPIILIISIPVFSYEEGINEIRNEFSDFQEYKVVLLEDEYKTLPVIDGQNELKFMSFRLYNHYYYYILNNDYDEVYFMRDPYSGRIVELNQGYWHLP